MGFTSIDDMINQMTTNGQSTAVDFQKTNSAGATSAAGRWHETLTWTGVPAAVSFAGSAGVATALTSATTGALSNLGEGNVSTKTRHLLNAMSWTGSSTIPPASLILCDFLLYYPAMVVTGTPTVPNNGVTLPRYTNGVGVQAAVFAQSAFGAASPAITMNFQAHDASAQSCVMTSPGNSAPISTALLNNGQPYFPIPNGKLGVLNLQTYTIASGTTGTMVVVLFKPLMQIPLCAQYLPSERDCLYQLMSLPRIYDGACLGWMLGIGGAMTTLQTFGGRIQYVWG